MKNRISRAAVVAAVLATFATIQVAAAKTLYADAYRTKSSENVGDKTQTGFDHVFRRFHQDAEKAPEIGSRERLNTVFGGTHTDRAANAFNGVYMPHTFDVGPQAVNVWVLQHFDDLLFNDAVALEPNELQPGTLQGFDGVFNSNSGQAGATGTAILPPTFNIANNSGFDGGRGPSATTGVPEPATGLLMLLGATIWLTARRRRR